MILVVVQVNNDLDTIHFMNYAIIFVMGEVVFLAGVSCECSFSKK